MVGTAVDYLVRACLRPDALDAPGSAAGGAFDLDQRPEFEERARPAARDAIERIRLLDPCRRTLDASEWAELCRMCLVLTRFEQVFRTGAQENVVRVVLEAFRKVTSHRIEDLGVAMASRATVEDLARLGRAKPLTFNPGFEQSVELGGADADLIADGTLLDLKSKSSGSVVGRPELWQLLGYAFADTPDEYAIRSVGISALRWRSRATWPITDLLETIGSGPARPLADWRRDFAAAIPPLLRERS